MDNNKNSDSRPPPPENIVNLYDANVRQRVIIIDDQSLGRNILESIAKKISPHLIVNAFADPGEGLNACRQTPPDLLITDFRMPQMDGIQVIQQFRQIAGCRDVPVVVVTIIEDKGVRYKALEAGASDFLSRPFDHYECLARCRNLLQLHSHQKADRHRADFLEQKIAQATDEIRTREEDALLCLARAGEFRDECTGNHILRMAHCSRIIADALGLEREACDRIERAAPMHDIGKIGIPDHILLKPGKLTADERLIMESHTLIGHEILAKSSSIYLRLGSTIALHHHEKFDGSGYPYGLEGEAIPIEARIVAVADVLDALNTARPYKQAWSMSDSLGFIRSHAGSQFDPDCVSALFSRLSEIEDIYAQAADDD